MLFPSSLNSYWTRHCERSARKLASLKSSPPSPPSSETPLRPHGAPVTGHRAGHSGPRAHFLGPAVRHFPPHPAYPVRTPQQVSPSRATRSPALPHTRPRHGRPLPDACAVSPHQSGPIPQFRHGSCNMRTSVLSSLSIRAGRKPAGVTVARPGSITPNGIMPQAYVEASLPNALRQRRYGWLTLLRPTVPLCHAVRHLCPELPTQALQNCARQPKLPARDCAECRGI